MNLRYYTLKIKENIKLFYFQFKFLLKILQRADNFSTRKIIFLYIIRTLPNRLRIYTMPDKEIKISVDGIIFGFLSNSSELTISLEVLWDDIYELIDDFKPTDNSLIIDIGANIGIYSLMAAAKCKKCQIYAFEPNPDVFNRMIKNLRYNNALNIKAYNIAMGEKEGIKKFLKEKNTIVSRIVEDDFTGENLINVNMTSLDDFLSLNKIDSVDILKIDCEGSEYNVIIGALKSLSKIRKIIVEYHTLKLFKEVESILYENDFKLLLKKDIANFIGVAYFISER